MKHKLALLCAFLTSSILCGQPAAREMNTPIVHIAELDVDPTQLERFKAAAIENVKTTLTSEAGAQEFHAVFKRGVPGHVVVLEAYSNQQAYEAHIGSPHYKKFGSTVAPWVVKKTLHDVN